MKNGTRFSNLTTVLEDYDQSEFAVDPQGFRPEDGIASEARGFRKPPTPGPNAVMLFLIVSAACATAAIAAGSYALWLTRSQATHDALTNVQELLQVCQSRMVQMENDLNHLPAGA